MAAQALTLLSGAGEGRWDVREVNLLKIGSLAAVLASFVSCGPRMMTFRSATVSEFEGSMARLQGELRW